MKLFGHDRHGCDDPLQGASPLEIEIFLMLAYVIEQQEAIAMATDAQIEKLKTDVAALITAGVAEINAAVAAAQTASPDPAIDKLDADVQAATQSLTDAAAKLTTPTPPAPAPTA